MSNDQQHPDRDDPSGDNSPPSGREDDVVPAEKSPARDGQTPSIIEAFDEEGAGIAPKE